MQAAQQRSRAIVAVRSADVLTVLAAERAAVLAQTDAVAVEADAITVPSHLPRTSPSAPALHVVADVSGCSWSQQQQQRQRKLHGARRRRQEQTPSEPPTAPPSVARCCVAPASAALEVSGDHARNLVHNDTSVAIDTTVHRMKRMVNGVECRRVQLECTISTVPCYTCTIVIAYTVLYEWYKI